MIKRLVRSPRKKVKKAARVKVRGSSRRVLKRATAKPATIDSGTAPAEEIFLIYDAREAAHAKSKA